MLSEAYFSTQVKHTSVDGAYFRFMPDTPKLIGDRIRERREELQMKPADLHRASGVSISAVLQWESNKTKNLKLEHLFKVADALGVEPKWLASGTGVKLKSFTIEEAEAISRLRNALPKWRRYVVSLAMITDHDRQQLFLDMLSEHVPDEKLGDGWTRPDKLKERK
ncbi:MAG: XRE family transcriptional regulator [Betaproteobacteria bacterium]|nr:MAG: XRE family transcriptional regulator [Betaproteobacteria bacterium]